MVRYIYLALLLVPLILLTSCSTFQGGIDFGFGKVPSILIFFIVCAFAWWYLFKRK